MKLKIDKQYRSNLAAGHTVAFILVVIAIDSACLKKRSCWQVNWPTTGSPANFRREWSNFTQEGDLVHKGDTLVIMQAADIGAKLAQAEVAAPCCTGYGRRSQQRRP